MSLLAVLPVMYQESARRCITSILDQSRSSGLAEEELLVVDNSRDGFVSNPSDGFLIYRDPNGHNLGVARSWNIGAKAVLEQKKDYLVIISASLEFGPKMGHVWTEYLWGHHIVKSLGHGWHLIAIHRSVLETVGLFDENFYPAYEEDVDFSRRLFLAGLFSSQKDYIRPWVNAMSHGVGGHVYEISAPNAPLVEYYVEKWGGIKGEEKWDKPFNGGPLDYWPELTVPALAEKYKLESWW